MEEEGREIIKHARSLSMSSLSAWSNGEDLTPPRYEPIARMHDSEDTALIAAWEHGLQEAREREANRRGEAQQPVRQRWRQVAIKVAKLKTDAKVSTKIDQKTALKMRKMYAPDPTIGAAHSPFNSASVSERVHPTSKSSPKLTPTSSPHRGGRG